MRVVELTAGDESGQALFSGVATDVYRNDPAWASASEIEFANHWSQQTEQPDRLFQPCVVLDGERPVSRAVAIVRHGTVGEEGYIGFFECLENHADAARLALGHCEQLLQKAGVRSILAPKVDNQLFGCQISEFDLPHVCLTAHNPPYYLGYFEAAGYQTRQHVYSMYFSRETAGKQVEFTLPGFSTRTFDRSQLEREISLFHLLQPQIFSDRSGYIPRSLTEDRAMIEGLLPFIDDDLIVIAETDRGEPVGILVCLPDYYQSLAGKVVDRARIISIGIVPGYTRLGIGTLMGARLMKNLMPKTDLVFVEASLVLAQNIAPQALANRFPAKPGRSFVVLGKEIY